MPLGNAWVTLVPCLGLSGNVYDEMRQMAHNMRWNRDLWASKPLCLIGCAPAYESGGRRFESFRARQ